MHPYFFTPRHNLASSRFHTRVYHGSRVYTILSRDQQAGIVSQYSSVLKPKGLRERAPFVPIRWGKYARPQLNRVTQSLAQSLKQPWIKTITLRFMFLTLNYTTPLYKRVQKRRLALGFRLQLTYVRGCDMIMRSPSLWVIRLRCLRFVFTFRAVSAFAFSGCSVEIRYS